jgi:exopolysaccharide production protein ExoY
MWRTVEVCERISAVFLLLGLAPLMLPIAVAIQLLSSRSPLIAHRRVGWRGETLWMLKLRTMWDGSPSCGTTNGFVEYVDDEAGPGEKQAQDPRVPNWFSRFCRRHSIDEIPQLWHVICGDMALVGPRPVTAAEIRRYYGKDANEVLQVKP